MTSNNRRKADRVDVGIPAQLHTRTGPIAAEVVDLSRTGLRVRFPSSALPSFLVGGPNGAAEAAAELLAPSFELDMDFERFGPLLSKTMTPIRVGIPTDADDMIEVCCEFEGLLEDEETGYLELASPLPPLRDTVDVWVEVEPMSQPEPTPAEAARGSLPRQRYRALVSSVDLDAPPSLFCHTDMVARVGVRVRLKREEVGIPRGREASVSGALASLLARYGPELDLRLVGQSGDVWSGPARFSGVELPRAHPEEILVTIAFGRGHSLTELRSMGLISGAA